MKVREMLRMSSVNFDCAECPTCQHKNALNEGRIRGNGRVSRIEYNCEDCGARHTVILYLNSWGVVEWDFQYGYSTPQRCKVCGLMLPIHGPCSCIDVSW